MENKDFIKVTVALNIPLLLMLAIGFASFLIVKTIISPWILILVALSIFVGANVFYYFLLKNINKGIQSVEMRLEKIVVGDFTDNSASKTKKFMAFSNMHELVDSIFDSLKSTLGFVESIASGNLEVDIQTNKEDRISEKLVQLAKTLKEDKIELEKTKSSEEQRNWIASGLAQFSEVLRQDNQSLQQMSYKIVQNLVDYVNLNQGALFVLNEDNDDEVCYEVSGAVAYGREKLMNNRVKIGEGLVGRCAFEKKSIYMTEIPDNYIKITSGLGDSNPTNLLLVPCILDGKVFGIIEVASFKNIESHQIGFIEKLGESFASTISNTRIRERTNALLAASKSQADELAAHEEELRQNLEEMETTQEDLRRQMELNAEMKNELTYEKFLFDTLLEKIPARVFFKDKECRFIKASQSAVKKFGKQNYSEIIGLSDADLLDPEFAKKTMADERNIMNTREGRVNFVEHETLSNGNEIWKTVSKMPLIDPKGECVGTFGIISDITEFKLAEIESKRFKKNYDNVVKVIDSNWCVLALDDEGVIKNANHQFCDLFKLSASEIIGKPVDVFFKPYLVSGDLISTKVHEIIEEGTLNIERKYAIGSHKFVMTEHYLLIEQEKDLKELVMIATII